jgi:hypothetical protein
MERVVEIQILVVVAVAQEALADRQVVLEAVPVVKEQQLELLHLTLQELVVAVVALAQDNLIRPVHPDLVAVEVTVALVKLILAAVEALVQELVVLEEVE